MKYDFINDFDLVKEFFNLSNQELSDAIGTTSMSLYRWHMDDNNVRKSYLENFYNYAFDRKIEINKIKEAFYNEEIDQSENIILFHGAKDEIYGDISLEMSKLHNDFGKGFYLGERYEQATMFVSNYPNSSVYIIKFKLSNNLKYKTFDVDLEWMLAIAYYRGRLGKYSNHPKVKQIIKEIELNDYVVAPIADNRMFDLIDDFASGEITDIQCINSLSCTKLGRQFVFLSAKAIKNLQILRRCYLCNKEKLYYLNQKESINMMGKEKTRDIKRIYRNEGLYIDEILK